MANNILLDIKLQMPLKKFQDQLNEERNNWSAPMDVNVTTASTKNGKTVYKITVRDNANNSNECILIANQDENNQDNIILEPVTMRKLNHGFYNTAYGDNNVIGTAEDPLEFLIAALHDICHNNHGTMAYVDSTGDPLLVREGENISCSLGVVASDGTVFSSHNAENLVYGYDDDDFHVNVPINVWLASHAEVAQAIAGLSDINEKMDYIGKYLIQAKLKDEIEAEEFMDIFRQAGLFGFSSNMAKVIYKLLM